MHNFNYNELYEKYRKLIKENRYLKARIKELEAGRHFTESHPKSSQTQDPSSKDPNKNTTGKKIDDELFTIDPLPEKAVSLLP